MKKLMCFVLSLSLLLLFPYNVVFADEYPSRFVQLNYFDHEFVQENNLTYEYIVTYIINQKLDEPISVSDYFLFYRYDFFNRGLDRNKNSYRLDSYVIEPGYSELHFRVTITKDLAHSRYPSGDLTYLFSSHSVMYIKSDYVEPERVMNKFLLATPNYDDYTEIKDGQTLEVTHIIYNGVNVYLPDGNLYSLSDVPEIIYNNLDFYENYDYLVFYFNLSPDSRFYNSAVGQPRYEVFGLSYIVYDIDNVKTIFYDYKGQVVHERYGWVIMSYPRISVSVEDDIHYRARSAYEGGKADGIELGREQGYNEGYEKGYNAGYIQGKNEAHFEDLNLFSYLEALFGDNGLGRLLKLELLPGVSLGAVIMIPLAFWLVSFIMRWFR